jgi:hypothetical protein
MAYHRLAGKKPSIKVERRSENFKSAKKVNHINVPYTVSNTDKKRVKIIV